MLYYINEIVTYVTSMYVVCSHSEQSPTHGAPKIIRFFFLFFIDRRANWRLNYYLRSRDFVSANTFFRRRFRPKFFTRNLYTYIPFHSFQLIRAESSLETLTFRPSTDQSYIRHRTSFYDVVPEFNSKITVSISKSEKRTNLCARIAHYIFLVPWRAYVLLRRLTSQLKVLI